MLVSGQIDGPLVIEGSFIPGKDRSLKIAVKLPTELNAPLPVLDIHVDENTQVDKLNVYNDGSIVNNHGMLANPDNVNGLEAIYEVEPGHLNLSEFKNISGLGMGGTGLNDMNGGDLTINFGTSTTPDNRTFDGGITYHGIETTEIFLGTGDDTFHVSNTAERADDPSTPLVNEAFRTVTILNTGAGNDHVTVSTSADGNGLLAVNLEEPTDQITALLERHKWQLPVALDRDGAVAAKYGVTAIPQTVIINRDGTVARHFIGAGSHLATLGETIKGLTPGAAAPKEGTKAETPKGQ